MSSDPWYQPDNRNTLEDEGSDKDQATSSTVGTCTPAGGEEEDADENGEEEGEENNDDEAEDEEGNGGDESDSKNVAVL
ncbi:hypothetical protein F443_09001 [Phytophthora nicotianae P1569]|uniref:Uncharacterized protein n=1 Tax=Phytophthora nicotianae P1569 TaxID=1317065 RepID=V9F506_PHYNI|nr:hypothetical protein F443_09001 [Phytophthora nicotianae P1569]